MRGLTSLCALSAIVSAAVAAPYHALIKKQEAGTKPVFAHYMIGGIEDAHTKQDVDDAKALGIDAFALNFDQFAPWSEGTVDSLFNHADESGFKLFFSFDMSGNYFKSPSEYSEYLTKFLERPSYYKYNDKAVVSTFGGEEVSNDDWEGLRGQVGGHEILIIPSFYQAQPSPSFFNERPALDGILNWNSWPTVGEGKVPVSTQDDKVFQEAAKSANKLFMMGVSPLQFKHMEGQNWYRRGEANLENRIEQVFELQPDLIELQTWNDAGESHYMGNSWLDPIKGSPIPAYTQDYDHTAYKEILGPFIAAWKRGDADAGKMFPTNDAAAQGTFWHHTLLKDAQCSGFGKPDGIDNVEDLVTGVILVAEAESGLEVVATSGSTEIGKTELNPGFNKFAFDGLTAGKVTVEVRRDGNRVVGGSGPIEVSNSGEICNYNFQVVGLSA